MAHYIQTANVILDMVINAFFKEKKVVSCVNVRRPSVYLSVHPPGSSLPASHSTLLVLESPNLYA